MYYNYWLHCWRTFSLSPFANAAAFTKDTFEVTSVTVTLADGTAIEDGEMELAKGGSVQLAATVEGTGVYNNAVTWSIEDAEESGTYIMGGTLRVATNETATEVTVTATSVADPTVSGSVAVTIG